MFVVTMPYLCHGRFGKVSDPKNEAIGDKNFAENEYVIRKVRNIVDCGRLRLFRT